MTLANALPDDPKRIAQAITLAPEKCANFPAVRIAAWQKIKELRGQSVNVAQLEKMQQANRPAARSDVAHRILQAAQRNGFSSAALEGRL